MTNLKIRLLSKKIRRRLLVSVTAVVVIGSFGCQQEEDSSPYGAISVYDRKLCVERRGDIWCVTTSSKQGGDISYPRGAGRLFSFDGVRTSENDFLLVTREETCVGLPEYDGTYSIACAQWLLRGIHSLSPANDVTLPAGNGIRSVICRGHNVGATCSDIAGRKSRTVLKGLPLIEVSGGVHHLCGLDPQGTIHCDKLDTHEILRAPPSGNLGWRCGQRSPPEPRRYVDITSGKFHSCALERSGKLWCWGAGQNLSQTACFLEEEVNYGQARAPAGRFTSVHAGEYHTCGLRPGGTVECWGRNEFGQTAAPKDKFDKIVAGGSSNCGVTLEGSLRCWGKASGFGKEFERELQERGYLNGH